MCFGEPVLCFSPQPGVDGLWRREVAGPELLVAVTLARFGHSASLVTVLPKSALGQEVDVACRAAGVQPRALLDDGPSPCARVS